MQRPSRLSRFSAALLLTLAAALPALAQATRQVIRPTRHRFIRCLAILDLSAQQKVQIYGFVDAARPELEADALAVKAAADALRASLQAQPPDACQIGSDALGVQAARQTLIAARQALRDQIVGVLTPEQASRFQGCVDFPMGPLTATASTT